MRIIRKNDNSWHVVNNAGETVERCHNLATAKMYQQRYKRNGSPRPNRPISRMF